jgi:hypothetical protein
VPSFVSLYWPYPEVQKAKDSLIYNNDRDNPEEKIRDFFLGMDGVWKVMRRQEKLKLFLSPFLHALFGGQTIIGYVGVVNFLPPQRMLFFMITLFFNIYYSYGSYYGYTEAIAEIDDNISILMFPRFVNYFWYWKFRSLFILVLASTHFGLACSLSLRGILNRLGLGLGLGLDVYDVYAVSCLLHSHLSNPNPNSYPNSRAADNLPDLLPIRGLVKRKTLAYALVSRTLQFIHAPRTILYLAVDNTYCLLLCGCSG